MLAKRIIPCLDILNGRTVKGINFVDLRDAGDPAELAAMYAQQGADELVLLDIAATEEHRKTTTQVVREVARVINIPFTVGGGIRSIEDAGRLLEAGADKISINSSAVYRPALVSELADHFGSQCIVVAIDAKKINNQWMVHTQGGKQPAEKKLFTWAKEAGERGAGELLFTSMDHDGTTQGFAIDALNKLCRLVHVPVIASGGAGTMTHFAEVFLLANVQAALAASVFHYGTLRIPDLKKYLAQQHLTVRI